MTDRRLILAGGGLTALLAVFHFLVPLGWGDVLEPLTQDERATMYELALGFAVLFALMAWVSLRHTDELLVTKLGHAILGGFTLFWVARAIEGPAFGETNAAALSVLCLVAAALYATPLVRARTRRRHRPGDAGAPTEPKIPAMR